MDVQSKKINTIIAILNSTPSLSSSNLNKVKAELHQIISVKSVNPTQRRNLLKILHSTRALDSTLKSFLEFYRIRNRTHSIGQYLNQLEKHSESSIENISASERSNFQKRIVDLRNTLLHQADAYPKNEREVNELISDMHTLITRLATL